MDVLNSQALYRPSLTNYLHFAGKRPMQSATKAPHILLTAENKGMSTPSLSYKTGVSGTALLLIEHHDPQLSAFL